MKIKKKRRSSDNFADEDIVLVKESNDESHMNIVNMVNISSIHGKKKLLLGLYLLILSLLYQLMIAELRINYETWAVVKL